ncbi:MAG: ABC transporter ATP-binding protein [Methanomassiliicoccales archaeon]|jgi:putative ABC transport system ATP-binding protein
MPIIRCDNVRKRYITGDIIVDALKGVSLEIEKGEMVAVMGPSGCGKTTLLNCLSGIDDVTEGKVFIEETELTSMSDDKKSDFRARRMGFVFQFYNLLPVLTAVENVELPLLICGVEPKEARERAMDLVTQVGLKERAGLRPNALSGGERQRVTIARALANGPALVWADEPTGDLDKKTADSVVALMRKLNEENNETFVVVTHDPEVGQRCDRIIHMRDGNIISENGKAHVIAEEIKQLG